MAKRRKSAKSTELLPSTGATYDGLVGGIAELLEHARRAAARSVNSILTATYWEIGRRIVEHEQGGKARAEYGGALLKRLSNDLTRKYGRGFSERNLEQMRGFFLGWQISQTPSAKLEAHVRLPSAGDTAPEPLGLPEPARTDLVPAGVALSDLSLAVFPLSWSHYVRLLFVPNLYGRAFYESEAIRGGWSVRQLARQIGTQFFERTSRSRNPDEMLRKGQHPKPEDAVSVEDVVRDPYLLEFLNLKDEYSESELEEALIQHLEAFLLELGAGFTFVARQKRIRIGDEWYRIDLLLFHRRLKCLVVIDLKIGPFTPADAGQMSLYLTYAKEHLTEPGEHDPVGIILCSKKNDAVVHYAMGHMPAKVFASRYLSDLPDPEMLRREIVATEQALRTRAATRGLSHE